MTMPQVKTALLWFSDDAQRLLREAIERITKRPPD